MYAHGRRGCRDCVGYRNGVGVSWTGRGGKPGRWGCPMDIGKSISLSPDDLALSWWIRLLLVHTVTTILYNLGCYFSLRPQKFLKRIRYIYLTLTNIKDFILSVNIYIRILTFDPYDLRLPTIIAQITFVENVLIECSKYVLLKNIERERETDKTQLYKQI